MTQILSIGTGHEFAREQLEMGKNPQKYWVSCSVRVIDVRAVSAFRSRFVFSSSSGFWDRLDLISSLMHLWIN